MNFYWSDLAFALVCALYSLAGTRITTGLPLDTGEGIINAIALGVYAGIGGLIFYKANPNAALTEIFKKPQ